MEKRKVMKEGITPDKTWRRPFKTLLLIFLIVLVVVVVVLSFTVCRTAPDPKPDPEPVTLFTKIEVEEFLASNWRQGIGMKEMTQELRGEFPQAPIRIVDFDGANYILIEVKEGEFAVQGTSLRVPPFDPGDDKIITTIYIVP